jgi:hypothetical protein
MADSETTTLIAIMGTYGVPFFTETVKFLYGQATEVLKARRERKREGESGIDHEPQITPITPEEIPDIFEGQLGPLQVDFEALDRVADGLNDLRKEIGDYAQGIEVIDPKDQDMVVKVAAIRELLEVVYSQRITFKGEQRESSGPLVHGSVRVKELAGDATAVRSGLITGGTVIGQAEAEKVSSSGRLVGVEAEIIKPGN